MMRVGISCEFIGTKRAGTATYSMNLLKGLAQWGGEHQFFPYLSSREALPLVPQAPTISPRMVYPYNSYIRLSFTLPGELLRRPVDLLHAQGWGPIWSPCPMVLTVHDIGWETFPQIYPRLLAMRLSYLVRSSAYRAVRIIASSNYTARDLVRVYGISEEKIRVVYPASNPDITRVTNPGEIEQVRMRYGLAGPYMLYVGSIEPKKNVDRLIRAYAALRRERDVAHKLVIAGKPLWLSEPILALPTELGLEGDVVFTGQVPQENLAALYSGADIFAFLGMYEGFGYPPLEATACGTPVLAANRTSLPEVLGNAALLVDPDKPQEIVQGLARLIDDEGLRMQLRRDGLDRVVQFQLVSHVQQVLAVYEECIAATRHAQAQMVAGHPVVPVAAGSLQHKEEMHE